MGPKSGITGGLVRSAGRGAGLALWAVALAPAVVLLPASLLDRGPSGEVRVTAFPLALAALDDYVWDCASNSLMMASAVTFTSGILGLALARGLRRGTFRGRGLMAGLAFAAVVVPPGFASIGLRGLADRAGLARHFVTPDVVIGWLIWFWVEVARSTPVVTLAALSALARVGPSVEDAARLFGFSRRTTWRKLVWPTVRPSTARALGLVFTLTLFDPGAPVVLGLRRTLAVQAVDAALDRDRLGEAAVLALTAVSLAWVARKVLRHWAGVEDPADAEPVSVEGRATAASAFLVATGLVVASALAWLPTVGLLVLAMGGAANGLVFVSLGRDPWVTRVLCNSVGVGLAAVAIDLLLARALASLATKRPGFARLADAAASVPPLAVGVGALALPWLLSAAADTVSGRFVSRGGWALATSLRAASDAIDPDRTPWVLLVVAVASVRASLPARSAVDRRGSLRPILLDAAVTLGTPDRKARRSLAGRWLGVTPGATLLTLTLAIGNLSPALILCPTADVRTLGPTVLELARATGAGPAQAAALATVAIAANLFALALAARRPSSAHADVFRGL